MNPLPYVSPLRGADLRYSRLDVDPDCLTPPHEVNCRCAAVAPWFSGNAHQRRVKRRAHARAMRKEQA